MTLLHPPMQVHPKIILKINVSSNLQMRWNALTRQVKKSIIIPSNSSIMKTKGHLFNLINMPYNSRHSMCSSKRKVYLCL